MRESPWVVYLAVMSHQTSPRSLSTTCVHGGPRPTSARPGVVTGIDLSSTYLLGEEQYAEIRAGRGHEARVYSRYGNPTVEALELRIAALEGAEHSRMFASGMGALHGMLLASCARGGAGHIVAATTIYGGSREFLSTVWNDLGGRTSFVDLEDEAALEAALADDARGLLCESMANPTLEISDLPGLSQRCARHGVPLLVDATFATPILQRPLELGASLVMHSASKYLGGHSDLIGGVVSGGGELMGRVEAWRRRTGGVMDPQAAFLVERGVKTLALRVRAQAANARALASALAAHPRVARVVYPGLPDFVHAKRATELLSDTGSMIFFELQGDDDLALKLLSELRLAIPAASLGGVETLVCTPATTSHAAMTTEERESVGIAPGAVRVSVGIEERADLIADFSRALDRT